MSKYLIEFKSTGARVILEYNVNGCLKYYEQSGDWTKENFTNFFKVFPFLQEHLSDWKDRQKKWKVKVSEVPEDLSFDRFWADYSHKVGNKPRAKKLWESLSNDNKVLALNYLPTYETHLAQNKGQQKLYAETYLNQRRWDV